jgi:hypothetical protein
MKEYWTHSYLDCAAVERYNEEKGRSFWGERPTRMPVVVKAPISTGREVVCLVSRAEIYCPLFDVCTYGAKVSEIYPEKPWGLKEELFPKTRPAVGKMEPTMMDEK